MQVLLHNVLHAGLCDEMALIEKYLLVIFFFSLSCTMKGFFLELLKNEYNEIK
jgi:hypothetical protein